VDRNAVDGSCFYIIKQDWVICIPGVFLERYCNENTSSAWCFVSSRAQMGPSRAEVIDDSLTADKPSGCELHVYSKAGSYTAFTETLTASHCLAQEQPPYTRFHRR
jgi:hypothetical protein